VSAAALGEILREGASVAGAAGSVFCLVGGTALASGFRWRTLSFCFALPDLAALGFFGAGSAAGRIRRSRTSPIFAARPELRGGDGFSLIEEVELLAPACRVLFFGRGVCVAMTGHVGPMAELVHRDKDVRASALGYFCTGCRCGRRA